MSRTGVGVCQPGPTWPGERRPPWPPWLTLVGHCQAEGPGHLANSELPWVTQHALIKILSKKGENATNPKCGRPSALHTVQPWEVCLRTYELCVAGVLGVDHGQEGAWGPQAEVMEARRGPSGMVFSPSVMPNGERAVLRAWIQLFLTLALHRAVRGLNSGQSTPGDGLPIQHFWPLRSKHQHPSQM